MLKFDWLRARHSGVRRGVITNLLLQFFSANFGVMKFRSPPGNTVGKEESLGVIFRALGVSSLLLPHTSRAYLSAILSYIKFVVGSRETCEGTRVAARRGRLSRARPSLFHACGETCRAVGSPVTRGKCVIVRSLSHACVRACVRAPIQFDVRLADPPLAASPWRDTRCTANNSPGDPVMQGAGRSRTRWKQGRKVTTFVFFF